MCGYCAGNGCENRVLLEVCSSDDDDGNPALAPTSDNEENSAEPSEKKSENVIYKRSES